MTALISVLVAAAIACGVFWVTLARYEGRVQIKHKEEDSVAFAHITPESPRDRSPSIMIRIGDALVASDSIEGVVLHGAGEDTFVYLKSGNFFRTDLSVEDVAEALRRAGVPIIQGGGIG